MAKAKTKSEKKRSIRFAPDPGTLAAVGFNEGTAKAFTLFGLVLNESSSGCALVVMSDVKLKKDMECRCIVGHLPNTPASIRWVKELEKGLMKIGLEYDLSE